MSYPNLEHNFALERCPHCRISRPHLTMRADINTEDHTGSVKRRWGIYGCRSCGMVVSAFAPQLQFEAEGYFPKIAELSETIPAKPREFLRQARESIHAPAGAIMLACSSVDAMLKEKGYRVGNLYPRIEQAATDHVITSEMATWAHQIRLDANDQRHADEQAAMPDGKAAERILEFTAALAQFLFVLPALVNAGVKKTAPGAKLPKSR